MTPEFFAALYKKIDPRSEGAKYVDLISAQPRKLPPPGTVKSALDDVQEALGALILSRPAFPEETRDRAYWNEAIVILLVRAARSLRPAPTEDDAEQKR
jgi:hypothetical protein